MARDSRKPDIVSEDAMDLIVEPAADFRGPKAKLADQAVKTAVKQVEAAAKARAGRFTQIAKFEAAYNGENRKALRGRNNVPFDSVLIRGYVDALHSKIDEKILITFERSPGRQQDKKPAQKLSAVVDHLRGPDQGAWDIKDLGVKKLAIFSGRGIYKKYSARDAGEFCDYFEEVDHWDFLTEPQGGGHLDKHLYKGQINIFRSADELRAGGKSGKYDPRQVEKLILATGDKEAKKNEELFQHKISRASSLGIDFEATANDGSKLLRLTEWVMFWRGEWYYMVFSYEHGVWIRFEKLADVFSVAAEKKGRGPWVSFATHFDPFVFWSIGPCDSVYPIASAMKKVVNLSLDNLEKRNWNMRAYDSNVFDAKDLIYRHDGLVKAKVRINGDIGKHIFTFETPDTTAITVNLTEWLDNFLGRQTGITADARGQSDQQKVGIYVGDMQQVADRLGLTNKMYEQSHVDIALNAMYGLIDHMPETYAIQVIGNDGIEWNEELKRTEIKGKKFAIRVRGTNAEEKMNAVLMQRKQNTLVMLSRDPELRARTNQTWRLRETLLLGGYDAEDLRQALDVNNDADDTLLAEAAAAIELIITGKKPKMNRGATTGFVRKILDYAWDTEDLDQPTFDRLIAYANLHVPIAQYNMQRKAVSVIAGAGLLGADKPALTAPAGGDPNALVDKSLPPEMGGGSMGAPDASQAPAGGQGGGAY